MSEEHIAMKPRTLLRTKEVAEQIGVSENTLRWWRHTGQGPKSFTLGARRVVYDVDDVTRWVEEQYEAADKKAVSA
jgi:predicted DNA-binding transcriptional regulator AlpA